MFFKIALRNILKRKILTIINVIGLAIGLAAGLLIYLYITDEYEYDKFYPEVERIYRVVREHGEGGEKQGSAAINYKFGVLAKDNLSRIEKLVRIGGPNEIKVEFKGQNFLEKRAFYADPDFFDLFGVELKAGSPSALTKPFTVVLSTKSAKKIFGSSNPINQSLIIDGRNYTVTGLAEPLPEKAHFHFDYLISLESTREFYGESMFEHWGNIWLYTYVLLNENTEMSSFEKEINQMVTTHGPPELKDFGVRFYTQPITDIHLHSQLGSEIEKNGDIKLLNILFSVAVLILLIACFNFINLTTARSAWRSKEVGIKKVLGVKRAELVKQFLGESLLITFISLLVALVIVSVLLPFFNYFTGKVFSNADLFYSIPTLCLIVLLVGLIAGIIPSLFLSSFEPAKILKGQSGQGSSGLAAVLRHVLIIVQFSISIILIIGSLVIYQQLNFVKSKDLGADIDKVMVLKLKNADTRNNREALINEFEQMPEITSVAAASDVMFEGLNSWRVKPKGVDIPHELISIIAVDEKYINSFGIALTENSPETASRPKDQQSVVVNEAFVKHFMLGDAVGEEIEIGHFEHPIRIAGVVKDFHFESLHQTIRPVMLYLQPDWYTKLILKTSSTNNQAMIGNIHSIWNKVNQGEEFDYYFLDEAFSNLYQSEEKTGQLVAYFSFFSVLIACLGLYGLAAYVAESKLKEISVRKILGASIKSLVTLQFNVFIKLIIVAGFLSIPIGYFVMNGWLQNFAYRINIQWWVLPVALFSVLLFTVISVGYRSLEAALTNPTDNLRNE